MSEVIEKLISELEKVCRTQVGPFTLSGEHLHLLLIAAKGTLSATPPAQPHPETPQGEEACLECGKGRMSGNHLEGWVPGSGVYWHDFVTRRLAPDHDRCPNHSRQRACTLDDGHDGPCFFDVVVPKGQPESASLAHENAALIAEIRLIVANWRDRSRNNIECAPFRKVGIAQKQCADELDALLARTAKAERKPR